MKKERLRSLFKGLTKIVRHPPPSFTKLGNYLSTLKSSLLITEFTNSSTLWSDQSSKLPTVYTHSFGSSNQSYVGTGSTGSVAIHTGTAPAQYWQLKTDNGDIATHFHPTFRLNKIQTQANRL